MDPADAGLLILCTACGAALRAPSIIFSNTMRGPTQIAQPTTPVEALAHTPLVVTSSIKPCHRLPLVVGTVAAVVLLAAGIAFLAGSLGRGNGDHKPISQLRLTTQPDTRQNIGQATQPTQPAALIAQGDPDHPALLSTPRARKTTDPNASLADWAYRIKEPPQPVVEPKVVTQDATPKVDPKPVEIATTLPTTAPSVDAVATAPPIQSSRNRRQTPRRPVARPIVMPSTGIGDQEIGRAITKAVDHLLSQFDPAKAQLRDVKTDPPSTHDAGLNALAVYALLQAAQALPEDPRLNIRGRTLKPLIDRMRDMQFKGGPETYARAIRATALAVHNRVEDRAALQADLQWLLEGTHDGGYTYIEQHRALPHWDNSNSQYGLLGVWSAAEVGLDVPDSYWAKIRQHWMDSQAENGQWAYGDGGISGTLSMTAAGIASMFVAFDYLDAPRVATAVGGDPLPRALARALHWLESGDNGAPIAVDGYTMYGLERVGLASGLKYFGQRDWYKHFASKLIRGQQPDGSWGFGTVDHSYFLLFLARGRHPVLMNKLRIDDGAGGERAFWANRPRDVASLTRFAVRELERPLNWQIVPLSRDWTEWFDSPVLYLASHQPIALGDREIEKLRSFARAGGMLFLHADAASPQFDAFARELAGKLFPEHELAELPPDHEVYSLHFKIDPKPRLLGVSNGVRLLMVYSPQDLAQHWQGRDEAGQRTSFEQGVNLFLYAAGKSDLRNRLASPYLPPVPANVKPSHTLSLTRAKHGGKWDPEPDAFVRFGRWLEYQTGYRLLLNEASVLELDPDRHPAAHLTVGGGYDFTQAEIDAVRQYIERGGTMIVEAAGSSPAAIESLGVGLLGRAFAQTKRTILPGDHLIYTGREEGMDAADRPSLRIGTERLLGKGAARLELIEHGKGRVIYSPLDLSAGLVQTGAQSVMGYTPAYAQSLMRNLVLWAAEGHVPE